MKAQLMAGALALLMLAMAVPTTGYHIDRSVAGDWNMAIPGLIICETLGPNDDRNSNPGGPLPGNGGLCTTGENDATGTYPYDESLDRIPGQRAAQPSADDWIRLDACSVLTLARGVGGDCSGGLTNQHGYFAEVGAYGCFVPTFTGTGGFPPGSITQDHAFYYRALYAWWSYDGDGSYTPGDNTGALHSGDGDNDNRDTNPLLLGTDIEDAWHGHASMFIDLSESTATASTSGSAETALFTEAQIDAWRGTGPGNTDNLNDGIHGAGGGDLGATAQGYTNDCNGSPSNAPSPMGTGPVFHGNTGIGMDHTGPVFVAVNCDNYAGIPPANCPTA